jgi:hypothetical protein
MTPNPSPSKAVVDPGPELTPLQERAVEERYLGVWPDERDERLDMDLEPFPDGSLV